MTTQNDRKVLFSPTPDENRGPVSLVYTGAESYVELRVQDFACPEIVATYVFDQHDGWMMRELGQSLIAAAALFGIED